MDKLTSPPPSAKMTGENAGRRPSALKAMAGGPERSSSVSERRPLGVYVHFPWCISKCPYCDFLSIPAARHEIPSQRYAEAVSNEIVSRRAELGPHRLRSVFFGGGTPSLWQAKDLGRVLKQILVSFEAGSEPPEVTVECNPGSLSFDHARALLDAGVNRLSIGVQALDAERLKFLGRWHTPEEALAAIKAALAAGMPRVSADLIYGVAGQAPEQAAAEVRRLAELGLTHVSAYTLTIEPQTAFGALARKGRLPLALEQSVADSFEAVDRELSSLGFEHYEISNFAKAGQRSLHNLGYWQGLDYVGLGCGAWGTVERAQAGEQTRIRYRNRPQPEGYITQALGLSKAGSPEPLRELESESEALTPEMRLAEALMLGLRLAEGIDVEEVVGRTSAQFWTPERRRAAARLQARGQLVEAGSRLFIPRSAWLLSDGIIAALA